MSHTSVSLTVGMGSKWTPRAHTHMTLLVNVFYLSWSFGSRIFSNIDSIQRHPQVPKTLNSFISPLSVQLAWFDAVGGGRDGSVVKSTCGSSRGPGFSSQEPHQVAHSYLPPVHKWYTHTQINKNKNKYFLIYIKGKKRFPRRPKFISC